VRRSSLLLLLMLLRLLLLLLLLLQGDTFLARGGMRSVEFKVRVQGSNAAGMIKLLDKGCMLGGLLSCAVLSGVSCVGLMRGRGPVGVPADQLCVGGRGC